MLFTMIINLVKKNFSESTDRVHFIKKIRDLLLTDLKI